MKLRRRKLGVNVVLVLAGVRGLTLYECQWRHPTARSPACRQLDSRWYRPVSRLRLRAGWRACSCAPSGFASLPQYSRASRRRSRAVRGKASASGCRGQGDPAGQRQIKERTVDFETASWPWQNAHTSSRSAHPPRRKGATSVMSEPDHDLRRMR